MESAKENFRGKVLSSLFWQLLERGGVAIGGLLVQITLARLLSPEDFGALALILVFVLIGTVFSVSGFNTALVQAKECDALDYDTVFWISTVVSLTIWCAIAIAAPWVAEAFSTPAMTNPLRAMGGVIFLNSVNAVFIADIQRNLAFRKIFNASLSSLVVASVVGIGSALLGAGLWALVLYQLANSVVKTLLFLKQISWRPTFRFSRIKAKRLFGFSWKLLVSALLDTGYQSLSDIIIGKRFSTADLGLVAQGKHYPGVLAQILDGAIQPVMLSAVARVQKDPQAVKSLVRRSLKTSALAVVPIMTLAATLAEPLVAFALGAKWSGAVIYFQMYCFIYALWPIHTTNLSALNGVGRSDLFLKLEIVKKIVGFSILSVTVFVFQTPVAIVAGFMLSGVCSTLINAFPNRHVIGYGYLDQLMDLAPIWGLSLVSGAVAYVGFNFLQISGLLAIIASSILFAIVFLSLGMIFKCEALLYVLNCSRSYLLKFREVHSRG